jgi:hypothetical protein
MKRYRGGLGTLMRYIDVSHGIQKDLGSMEECVCIGSGSLPCAEGTVSIVTLRTGGETIGPRRDDRVNL